MEFPFPDHHIHTRYSRCCHENYDLGNVVHRLSSLNFPYYCVSDHIHWKDDDDWYFPEHVKKAIEIIHSGLQNPIFLGSEITILDLKGTLPNQNKSKDQVNYILIGDHFIPTTKITMDDISGSKKALKNMIENHEFAIKDLLKKVLDMYINAVRLNKPNVLVHPFSTLLRCGFTHIKLLDIFETVCEVCQECQTALEFNRAELNRAYIEKQKPLVETETFLEVSQFYDLIINIIKKFDIKISFGSDAHQLVDIGNLSIAIQTFNRFNFSRDRVLNFLEDERIKPFKL